VVPTLTLTSFVARMPQERTRMTPTIVFETYWRFAAERQAVFHRRLTGLPGPWTADPILRTFRFTNVYRAADRVSQYLIREIQYHPDRPQNPRELFFRTLLFKIFNRIETWEALERALGPLVWERSPLEKIAAVLDGLVIRGARIYSSAYIMPSPPFGHARKYANHLALVGQMMNDGLPEQIHRAPSLRTVYEAILRYPSFGPFLASQYTIDLNYSAIISFDESDFVVAGPGSLDGISKCFFDVGKRPSDEIIYLMADRQEAEFTRLGLHFEDLFGRRLQPIDCQNIFCEISKYARAAHPEVPSVTNRLRIKRSYQPHSLPLAPPLFPPRWRLAVPERLTSIRQRLANRQYSLL
jgi:alpha-glutamyl/putrescinyl thymine pyrophosphorylase clade 1